MSPPPRPRVPLELLRKRKPSQAELDAAGVGSIDELYDAVAVQFRVPRLHLDDVELSLDLMNFISGPLAVKHGIVPVFASNEELSIATTDPSQLAVFDWIAREQRRSITVCVSTPSEIERAQTRLYAARRAAPTAEESGDVTIEDLQAATRIVNAIIAGAIEQRASDIHIEATERETVIRYRVDGALRQIDTRAIEAPRRDRVAHQGPREPRHRDPSRAPGRAHQAAVRGR